MNLEDLINELLHIAVLSPATAVPPLPKASPVSPVPSPPPLGAASSLSVTQCPVPSWKRIKVGRGMVKKRGRGRENQSRGKHGRTVIGGWKVGVLLSP
ncbi:hypothetical protein GOBAR_DD35597 [Gossypium barbadense]|nr:hypothetical protein GOBAR_DD35597 [Gossypium barbadense]